MEVAAPRLATFDSLPWRQVRSRFAAMLHRAADVYLNSSSFSARDWWIHSGVRKAGLFLQPAAG
jgi:hypothetical protein